MRLVIDANLLGECIKIFSTGARFSGNDVEVKPEKTEYLCISHHRKAELL
jgi:hypothetical protein